MAGILESPNAEIDRRAAATGSEELIREFRRRFPLVGRVVGQFGESLPSERIPWFFGFILAAAANPGPGACCFVLDKTAGTTAIAAILSGLVRLERDFPTLVERYARTALGRGQRVKVKPSDFVFEYQGIWEDSPKFFKLKLVGENAWRSFPLHDVLRLEPTDRIRPKGTGGSDLGTFEPSPIDQLLELATCGNNSLIQNAVLVQMPRAHLARVAEATSLTPRHSKQLAPLSHFLPWGSIGPGGTLRPNDPFQVIGEPLIAATSILEDLASASSAADVGTRTAFVDGAGRLARNLQGFDDIADRQRLVVVASPDEGEDVELLKDRGCTVWNMSADEVLIGETPSGGRARASIVGGTVRAANVRRRYSMQMVDCRDDVLEAASTSLERVAEMIADCEEAPEVEEALARLFTILFECSECCFGVGEATNSDLQAAREQMARDLRWLEPVVRQELRNAVDALERAITIGFGDEKEDALLSIYTGEAGKWTVGVRSPRTAQRLQQDLNALGVDLPVLPVSAVTPDHEFAGIILPSWPNDYRFTRLRNLCITPDIRILAYPFESKWVLRYRARERTRAQSGRLETETLSSLLGIERRLISPLRDGDGKARDSPGRQIPPDHPVFTLEDRVVRRRLTPSPLSSSGEDGRNAQLVRFFGGCHALLTEWAELPVLNDLIDSSKGESARLTTAPVSRLSTGDFVLFRASGDKEFLRLIAEDALGTEEYRRLRSVAERWKTALRCLGDSPAAVQQRLADHGLQRTFPTISGWLGNPDRIGPRDRGDVEVIAKAAGDTELLSTIDVLQEAMTRIRGAHQSAGVQLTRLILEELRGRLNEIGDQPTLLDLGYGEAWVVQVESVETEHCECPPSQVNKLLWVADNAF